MMRPMMYTPARSRIPRFRDNQILIFQGLFSGCPGGTYPGKNAGLNTPPTHTFVP